jgi:TonB family protein
MKRLVSVAVYLALTISVSVISAQDTSPVIKGGLINGKAKSLPKPEYPEEARGAKIEGTVFVDVTVDEDGNVISASAAIDPRKSYTGQDMRKAGGEVPPADPILRDAAERAAWEAKFSPTLLSGMPVKVQGTLVYRFVLPRNVAIAGEIPSSGVLNGKAISLPKPAYPPAAAAVRAEGAVSVQLTVDQNGSVVSAKAVSGHPLLRAAAEEAAWSAKFSPTMVDGNPVSITGVITYNFVAPKRKM